MMNTDVRKASKLLLCTLLAIFAMTAQTLAAVNPTAQDSLTMVKLDVKRLADLNISRSGHCLLCLDGELVVIGGHTQGFVLTPTAEYYKEGAWHVMPMVYPHDFGIVLPLSTGKVLIGGGAEKNLGIGQTHPVELYDPTTHTFQGFGCLDTKRMYANATELGNGQVVISGNWYHGDDIELFDGHKHFIHAKDVSRHRTLPSILPIAKDDALIIGSADTTFSHLDDFPTVVDRLRGKSFDIPLLAEWCPHRCLLPNAANNCFVGDTARGDYSYLLLMENRGLTQAIGRLRGTDLRLLPSVSPLPKEGLNGPIDFRPQVIVDRKAGRGYVVGNALDKGLLMGEDSIRRYYVYSFNLEQAAHDPGALQLDSTTTGKGTLYYTDPLPNLGDCIPVLTPEGNLAMVGGTTTDNFFPTKGAYLLLLGELPATANADTAPTHGPWLWIVLVLAVLGMLVFAIYKVRTSRVCSAISAEDIYPIESDEDLLTRICRLMEEQQLYLNSELKLSDIAVLLKTNGRNISACIKSIRGCSFSQFVGEYRVRYAQQLLRQHPDKKIMDVALQAGFSNEMSFFRTFKTITGMTPKEWVQQNL